MRIEPVNQPSLLRNTLPIVLAIFATMLFGSFFVMLAHADPFSVFKLIAQGTFGSSYAIFETLNRTTPLIFTGLAVAVAFRARFWNIGAEAQLYAGAVVTAWLGAGLLNWPTFILLPFCALTAAMAGALVLLFPAQLKLRFGVDEVVTTLLFNFIFLLFISYLLEGPMKDPMGMGWPKSSRLIEEARLPRLSQDLRLHWGFVVALFCAIVIWVMQAKTTLGYSIRAVGSNVHAAKFAGINVNKVVLLTALISGGLAGLAGWSETAGVKGALTLDLSPGFGYTGIIVAMLAKLHPLGVVVAATFVAAIFVGADSMSRVAGVPSYIANLMLAASLLFMVFAMFFTRYKIVKG